MAYTFKRVRAEFKKWSASFVVRYDADRISLEQLIQLFEVAGMVNGIGEWRPANSGANGMFHVGSVYTLKKVYPKPLKGAI